MIEVVGGVMTPPYDFYYLCIITELSQKVNRMFSANATLFHFFQRRKEKPTQGFRLRRLCICYIYSANLRISS